MSYVKIGSLWVNIGTDQLNTAKITSTDPELESLSGEAQNQEQINIEVKEALQSTAGGPRTQFLGVYATRDDFLLAHPSGVEGDYSYIGEQQGNVFILREEAVWAVILTPPEWIFIVTDGAGISINTNIVATVDPSTESLSGTANNQEEVNKENKIALETGTIPTERVSLSNPATESMTTIAINQSEANEEFKNAINGIESEIHGDATLNSHGYIDNLLLINKDGNYYGDLNTLNIPSQVTRSFTVSSQIKYANPLNPQDYLVTQNREDVMQNAGKLMSYRAKRTVSDPAFWYPMDSTNWTPHSTNIADIYWSPTQPGTGANWIQWKFNQRLQGNNAYGFQEQGTGWGSAQLFPNNAGGMNLYLGRTFTAFTNAVVLNGANYTNGYQPSSGVYNTEYLILGVGKEFNLTLTEEFTGKLFFATLVDGVLSQWIENPLIVNTNLTSAQINLLPLISDGITTYNNRLDFLITIAGTAYQANSIKMDASRVTANSGYIYETGFITNENENLHGQFQRYYNVETQLWSDYVMYPQRTNNLAVTNPLIESLSGTATAQSTVNEENVTYLKNLETNQVNVTNPTTESISGSLDHQNLINEENVMAINNKVALTGNETVNGIKTFVVSPQGPSGGTTASNMAVIGDLLTNKIAVSTPATETLSGTAVTQSAANIEFTNRIKGLGTVLFVGSQTASIAGTSSITLGAGWNTLYDYIEITFTNGNNDFTATDIIQTNRITTDPTSIVAQCGAVYLTTTPLGHNLFTFRNSVAINNLVFGYGFATSVMPGGITQAGVAVTILRVVGIKN